MADGWTYTVSLKVTDANNGVSTCVSTTATWNNVKPTMAISNNWPKAESNSIRYTFTWTDTWGWTLKYYVYSDAAMNSLLTSGSVTSWSPKTYDKTLDEPGTYAIYVKYEDANGSVVTWSSTATWTNTAPVSVSVSNNGPVNEWSQITYTASYKDTWASVTYQWYQGANCSTTIAWETSQTFKKTLADGWTFVVSVKVTDSQWSGTCSAVSTWTWKNIGPVGYITNNGPVNEWSQITYTFSGSDTWGWNLTYAIYEWASCAWSALQTYSNIAAWTNKTWTKTLADGWTYTVSLKVTDANNGVSTCVSTTATWNNTAPVNVSISNNWPKAEESEITYTASATDTWATLSYQWYTGANCMNAIVWATSGTYKKTLTEPGTYSVYVKVSDSQWSGTCSAVNTAIWTNVAPTNVTITDNDSVPECTQNTFTANAIDVDATFSYQWYTWANCTNAIEWETSQMYSNRLNYSGTYSLYVKVSDSQWSGTCSAAHTASWTNTLPTASNITVNGVWTWKTVNWKTESNAQDGACWFTGITVATVTTSSSMWSCTISWNYISFVANSGDVGTTTCVITISDDENSTKDVTVTWNDIYKPIPQISFIGSTPTHGSAVDQNRFITKMSITNIDSIKSLKYVYNDSPYDLASGLVLMYNFDKVSSLWETNTVVKDLSNNWNDGTVYWATWTSNGKYGWAYSFDWVDDYIQLPSSLWYGNNISVFVWFKSNWTPEGGYHTIFWWPQLEISVSTAWTLRAWLYINWSRIYDDYSSNLTDWKWHFIWVVYDWNVKKTYVDWALIGSRSVVWNLTTSFNRTIWTHWSNTSYDVNGLLDEVRIYDHALSLDEVQFLYKSNLKKTDATTWEFETLNTCLDATWTIYNYTWIVKSFVDTSASTGRKLVSNVSKVSVDWTWYHFWSYETTGAEYVLWWTMWTLTVTDKLGNSWWFVYLATSESLVWSATQEKISTNNLKFKANNLVYNGMYDWYSNTHVMFGSWISTTEYKVAKSSCTWLQHCLTNYAILEYMKRTVDTGDFMCWDVGTYSDNTSIKLEVPAWQVEDTYEWILWITLQDSYWLEQNWTRFVWKNWERTGSTN